MFIFLLVSKRHEYIFFFPPLNLLKLVTLQFYYLFSGGLLHSMSVNTSFPLMMKWMRS